MTYPQAIFGGLVAIAISIAALGLADRGIAQSPAGYWAVAPVGETLGIIQVNTSAGALRYCTADDKLATVSCGPWSG
jgi:hypothetical protein